MALTLRAALRPDRDRLPVTLSPHIEVSRKATARDICDDFRSAGMAPDTLRVASPPFGESLHLHLKSGIIDHCHRRSITRICNRLGAMVSGDAAFGNAIR